MKRVVAGLIVKQGKLLVCQRTRHQTMPLKWEFPGGKIEEGEQPRDALRRELEEELGILATIGDEVKRIQHEYPNGGTVELRFFVVRELPEGNREPHLSRHPVGRAARPAEVRLPGSGPDAGAGSGCGETVVDVIPAQRVPAHEMIARKSPRLAKDARHGAPGAAPAPHNIHQTNRSAASRTRPQLARPSQPWSSRRLR